MSKIWAVCKRELKSYFTTPIGFVIVGAFAGLSGLYFTINFLLYAQQTTGGSRVGEGEIPDLEEYFLSPYMVLCGQLIMFIGALITMRLLAEERNKGTMELLLTYPLSDRQIVFGKYLSALVILVVMIAMLTGHVGIVGWFTGVETYVLLFGLVTVFLMGAAFLSIGVFISAVCRNQVTAGVTTFAVWLSSWVLGRLGENLPEKLGIPGEWPQWVSQAIGFFYGLFRGVVIEMPLDAHAHDMAEGFVELQDVLYYVLFVVFFLFLTLRALESRQWRG